MENQLKEVALEESTNTHTAKGVKTLNRETTHVEVMVDPQEAHVVHGEHRVIGLESRNLLVYRQQEYNPVLKAHYNVVD